MYKSTRISFSSKINFRTEKIICRPENSDIARDIFRGVNNKKRITRWNFHEIFDVG